MFSKQLLCKTLETTLVKYSKFMSTSSSSNLEFPSFSLQTLINGLQEKVVDGVSVKVVPPEIAAKTVGEYFSSAPKFFLSFGLVNIPCNKDGSLLLPYPEFISKALEKVRFRGNATPEAVKLTEYPIFVVNSPKKYFPTEVKKGSYIVDEFENEHDVFTITCVAIDSALGRVIQAKEFPPLSAETGNTGIELFYLAQYEDSPFLLNDFASYLKICKILCDTRVAYSNIMSIVQASGFGKSKLAYEAGNLCFAVVTSGVNHSGFPTETDVLVKFLNYLKGLTVKMGVVNVSLYIILTQNFLIRLLFYASKNGKNEKKSIIFSNEELVGNDILYGFEDFAAGAAWKNLEYSGNADLMDVVFIPDAKNEITIESFSNCLRQFNERRINDALPNAIVFIDEASCLLKKYTNFEISCCQGTVGIKMDFYRLFRKSVKFSKLIRDNIYVCLISTTSLISNLNPTLEDDPSWRPGDPEIKLLPPFNIIQNLDVFHRTITQNTSTDLKEFAQSSQRMISTFICGRPLFGTMASGVVMRELATKYGVKEAVSFFPVQDFPKVIDKLSRIDRNALKYVCDAAPKVLFNCGKKYFPRLDMNQVGSSEDGLRKSLSSAFLADLDPKVSSWMVLSLSLVGFHAPSFVDAEESVRSRMAILLAVDNKRKRHAIMYTSEGQPNAMSSIILGDNLEEVLKRSVTETFFSLIDPSVNLVIDCGQVGELVARIGLLVTMLRTPYKVSRYGWKKGMAGDLYAPRDVFAFVEMLGGREVAQALKSKREDLEGAICCFNHFQASDELGNPSALVESMLRRGSARITPRGWHGADLLLPMVLKDGTASLIVVQVKRREKVGFADVFRRCCLKYVFSTPVYVAAEEVEEVEEEMEEASQSGDSRKKRKLVLDPKSEEDIKKIEDHYLIICLNVAERPQELSPTSFEITKNKWSVYETANVPAGLKCSGLSFAALKTHEREMLAYFCHLGHNLALVREFNPQTFAHLGCPEEINASDVSAPHPVYPYTVGQVRDALSTQPAREDFLEAAFKTLDISSRSTPNEKCQKLMQELKSLQSKAAVKASNKSLPSLNLPSLEEFYKSIHWNLFI